jgi:23S rRNA (adenine2503-C2)-methyltransferase
MNLAELQALCLEAGESRFRGEQLFEWLYRHGISSFSSMLNVNKSFRIYLEKNYILQTLDVETQKVSQQDQSIKILFKTRDGEFIETVSMVEGGRHTVCISSQAGCALDCSFCATASLGLKRNLTTGEIIDQLIYVRGNVDQPITNVVFMGMGEPFHNYDSVLNSADIFHSPKGFNLGSTRITISTAGLLPQIHRFINENRRYKLAISLNAANDKVRNEIMPINKKWNIKELIQAGREYSSQKKRHIMFEYVLLKGLNDSQSDALELSRLLKGIPCKLNIIPYNETDGKYQRPDDDSIMRFSRILHENRDGCRVLIRWSKGQDIDAGCGQLVGHIM